MDRVIKRDKKQVAFDREKIIICLRKANSEVKKRHRLTEEEIHSIALFVENVEQKALGVEAINDIIVNKLVELNKPEITTKFIEYRYKHKLRRAANTTDDSIAELLGGVSEYWNTENSNKNSKVVTTQRDYIAGISSTDIARRLLLPEDVVKAHDAGLLHFHDMDYFAQKSLNNCCLINLEDMLQNGTMINGVKIDKPKKLLTAATIATQIIAAVASSQYGGCTITLTHLAPFVRASYESYLEEAKSLFISKKKRLNYAKLKIDQEINAAVQTFNYQVNSMSTTNGQAPFISVSMYLGENSEYTKEVAMLTEEFLKQRMQGMKNRQGVYITQTFPKLIYILEEQNIRDNSQYYYLTELAAKCTAKRMVPDYISEKIMKEQKEGNCFPPMGCRSFLAPYKNSINLANSKTFKPNEYEFFGHFNQGVVTISLPDVAFSSKGDMKLFWKIFEERLELCHKALRCRHDRLLGCKSDMAPILWQDGAFARLAPGESIDKLLVNKYSTISLGYGGLYECVKYMTGHSHTDEVGREFGIQVMQYMNKKTDEWKVAEDIGYGIYGTPMESTTYKFAKCLKQRFGNDIFIKLDGEDRNYITNSYHVPVFEHISAFDKIKKEAEFQKYSISGAISYIESSNLQKNIPAALEIIKYIYDNIMYAEINLKTDFCDCGYEGEIELVELPGKNYKWRCPVCGNEDTSKMNIIRRTCGYLGANDFNTGRKGDIHDRFVHLDNRVCDCK